MSRTRLDPVLWPLLVCLPPDLLRAQLPEAAVGVLLRLHLHHRSRFGVSPVGGNLEYIAIVVSEACLENSLQLGSGWWAEKAASAFLVQLGPTFHFKDTSLDIQKHFIIGGARNQSSQVFKGLILVGHKPSLTLALEESIGLDMWTTDYISLWHYFESNYTQRTFWILKK